MQLVRQHEMDPFEEPIDTEKSRNWAHPATSGRSAKPGWRRSIASHAIESGRNRSCRRHNAASAGRFCDYALRRAKTRGRPARDRSHPRLRARHLGPERKARENCPPNGPRPIGAPIFAPPPARRSPRRSRHSITRSATSRLPFASFDAQPPRRSSLSVASTPIRDT